jgi:hypothetical protein
MSAKGYRLHAIAHGRLVRHWTLRPMNEHDSQAAAALLPRLDGGGGYVGADNAYDTNDCHRSAGEAGHVLASPPRPCNAGVRDARYNCPQRLRGLDLTDGPFAKFGIENAFGRDLYNMRQRIESGFGGLSMAGLGPLPAFVRRPRRVALWAAGKLLLFAWREAAKQGLMA